MQKSSISFVNKQPAEKYLNYLRLRRRQIFQPIALKRPKEKSVAIYCGLDIFWVHQILLLLDFSLR